MSERALIYSSASVLIDDYLERWLIEQLESAAGQEQEALIELVRSADLHAYFLQCFGEPDLTDQFAHTCTLVRAGIGPFLRVFLPKIEQCGDGIPWQPSTEAKATWADNALLHCGKLTLLRRLVHSERYGLVRCTVHSDKHLSIHLLATDKDSLDRADHFWMSRAKLDARQNLQEHLDRQMDGWAKDRIDQYVSVDQDHFIRYDSDWELLGLYQQQVESLMLTSVEADALPEDVKIGPRTFGEWKRIAIIGAARAMLHLSFATRLAANKKKLNLRNLLTIFVRHEDLRAVWSEQTSIENENALDEIADVFMLTADHANEYFSNHDAPLPYNIRFGKYFALLPQFGFLGNTCTFLVTELKRKYRNDWDRAVNQREAKFQQDLYALLAGPNYLRGRENFVIYRSDGERETDIDAVVYEISSHSVYLIQLKWFDVVAYSLRERQSKISNLLKANKWVDQVSRWASSVAAVDLLSHLDLLGHVSAVPSFQVRFIVLTRTAARFGGVHKFDERAGWISWPQLYRAASENGGCLSPLEMAWQGAVEKVHEESEQSGVPTRYILPGLQVDVYS